ncbi:unnamed protein product, partial [Rotaria sp. Silwood2]
MSKDMKHVVDNVDSSSIKYVRCNVTCLLDLPDKIIFYICRYMSLFHILYSFYTPSTPKMRLHRVIYDYYTKIKIDRITNNEYVYLSNLFSHLKTPLRPKSLILSNENVSCVIQRYFSYICRNIIQSIFIHLRYLTLIDCSSSDLNTIERYCLDMTQIEYFHMTIRKTNEHFSRFIDDKPDASINRLVFGRRRMYSLHKLIIDFSDGLELYKRLIPHKSLRYIDLVLKTIDDLYILLDGLVPNIEKMIIQLHHSRKLSCIRPKNTLPYFRLIEFTLLENHTGFFINDIKSILNYMPALIKLTLSIRDTRDLIFCQGPKLESILNEHLPHLCHFDYTMTHRITDSKLIEDFIQWPMNIVFYENGNVQWVHIFSLPWPSNKNDKRQLPIVRNGYNTSVTSNVKQTKYMTHVLITKHNQLNQLKKHFRRVNQITTCLFIDIKLPSRISKLILTKQSPITSISSIVQYSISHLTVECCLSNEGEIEILANQYPNVKYLKLLFPLEKTSNIRCFQTLFSVDDNINGNRRFWPQLINFSTNFNHKSNFIMDDNDVQHWLNQNTDMKFVKSRFYA